MEAIEGDVVTSFGDIPRVLLPIVVHIGPYLQVDTVLVTKLCRLLKEYIKQVHV